jgi:two-component system chemotaxis response regulator CheB
MIRVLLVDDSPVALAVLKRMLANAPGIEVVGTAVNGEEALRVLPTLRPQVICTDFHMPRMNGLALTKEIMAHTPLPILVVSVSVQHESDDENIFQFLEAGAIDVFPKPQGGLNDPDGSLTRELTTKIRVLSGVVPIRRRIRHVCQNPFLRDPHPDNALPDPATRRSTPAVPVPFDAASPFKIIGIGASTGGPQALQAILSALPARFPLPVVCVQHISLGFLNEMVNWLQTHTPLTVRIAQTGERPMPGHVYFPPEEHHLVFDNQGRFATTRDRNASLHTPSIDMTFHAMAHQYRHQSLGILLTGMGRDGAEGLLAIAQSGGQTIAQDEASCVVFGMPKQAIELGAAKRILPIDDIATTLAHLVHISSVR